MVLGFLSQILFKLRIQDFVAEFQRVRRKGQFGLLLNSDLATIAFLGVLRLTAALLFKAHVFGVGWLL